MTSRRPRTRFYDHDKIKTEIDLLSRYGHVRDDLDLHQFKESEYRRGVEDAGAAVKRSTAICCKLF